MKLSLAQLRIPTKIMLFGIVVSLSTLFFAAAAFVAYQYAALRQEEVQKIGLVSDVLAADVGPAIAFGDREGAQETLTSLRVMNSVSAAAIFTQSGQLFASYGRALSMQPERTAVAESRVTGTQFELSRPIILNGKLLGVVAIEGNLRELWKRLAEWLGILAVVMCLASLVAYALSSRLQAFISKPILDLASLTARVSATKDYSLRAETVAADEFGTLVAGLNEMLAQIQARDQELLSHRQDLERQVEERTLQLANLVDTLRQAKEVAENASHAKSSFLANMSHEIRTPLNGIVSLSRLVLESVTEPDAKEDIETIIECANSLASIINDVLDFSKIEAGKLTIAPHDMRIKDLLAGLLHIVAIQAKAKNIDLSVHISSMVPSECIADELRIKQVLTNLVGNAIKFTPEYGTIKLSIDLAELHDQTMLLKFSVIDSGIGIREEKQQEIFEAFSQADGSTTRKFGGTGLGLTICKRLVEMMGGTIWVQSKEGEGAAFFFTVTVERSSVAHAMEYDKAVVSSPVATSGNGLPKLLLERSLKILVAEDNEVNRDVITRVITQSGHAVIAAVNGKEALSLLQREKFDLVLMDLHMPEMGGIEATAAIRAANDADYRNIPIVALTAHAVKGVEDECRAAGMDEFVSKPINYERLFAVLQKLAVSQLKVPLATEPE